MRKLKRKCSAVAARTWMPPRNEWVGTEAETWPRSNEHISEAQGSAATMHMRRKRLGRWKLMVKMHFGAYLYLFVAVGMPGRKAITGVS